MWEHLILRWIHVLLVAYWLGGEWGVFHSSTNVANAKLGYDERRRFLETAFRIDIAPRTAIVLLLPVGFHMGANLGVSPITGPWLVALWIFFGLWVGLIWSAFAARGSERGMTLTTIDDRIRYVVIPLLFGFGVYSLLTGGPFTADWFAAKLIIFSFLLCIGLGLRWTMKAWVVGFQRLKAEGSNPEVEGIFSGTLARARKMAYVYWTLIATMAFIGIAKPF